MKDALKIAVGTFVGITTASVTLFSLVLNKRILKFATKKVLKNANEVVEELEDEGVDLL